MGWREKLAEWAGDYSCDEPDIKHDVVRIVPNVIMGMLDADRIALARELVAGTGRVVARESGELPDIPNPYVSDQFGKGWNACRAAMMEGE